MGLLNILIFGAWLAFNIASIRHRANRYFYGCPCPLCSAWIFIIDAVALTLLIFLNK